MSSNGPWSALRTSIDNEPGVCPGVGRSIREPSPSRSSVAVNGARSGGAKVVIGLIESRKLDDGRTNWTLATKLPLHDKAGKVVGLVGITREINEMRETEVALQHLATHDTLTDLPNRFLMIDRLNQLLARARRSGTAFAVL